MQLWPQLVFVLVFCAADVASADELPLPRSARINTISVYELREGTLGGLTPVTITIDKSPTNKLRLAFIEDEIDGYGEQWRAAAWVSTLMAVDLTGVDPRSIQVEFERSGRVDGPSAGGLTTIGILAALRGDSVRADAAMTGSINPDGTIGPVGGIPHKIDGAARAGMKLVLIPFGSRVGLDSNTNKQVDLFARGRAQGVEVKAVSDIYTAYELATGEALPRASSAKAPELEPEFYDKVTLKVNEWILRYKEYRDKYQRVPTRYRSDYTAELLRLADESAGRVKKSLDSGQAPMAFRDALAAAILAAEAVAIGETIWVDQVRGRQTARHYARTLDKVQSKMDIAIERLKQYQPQTLSECGAVLYGYTALTEAMSYQAAAEALLSGDVNLSVTDPDADPEEENILAAAVCTQIAALDCEHIRDLLELADELKGRELPDDAPVDVAADFFRRAAMANLNQFERVTVDDWADSAKISSAEARSRFMRREENYLIAKFAAQEAMPRIFRTFEGRTLQFAQLGAAIHTYTLSAALLAKYYSLDVTVDQDGVVTGVSSEASLRVMLDNAEDQARRNIQVLKDHGVDPAAVVFSYQAASILRGRDVNDRLSALHWLWEANIKSRTLAHLGGFAAPDEER